MVKKSRTESKIDDDIKSAGQSFLGIRMFDLLMRISELEDRYLKRKLVEEYYENQIGTHDKDIGGTTTRVNSAIRIIAADKVIYALSKIDGSDSRVLPEAVENARRTIQMIQNGTIKLPELE